MKKVIVSLSSDSNAMRECMIGILDYVNTGHDWQLKIVPDPFGNTAAGLTPQLVDAALCGGIDGVITGLDLHTPGFERLARSGIPLALNNAPPDWRPAPDAPVVMVRNDDVAVGKMGARHLYAKGNFLSFGYVPADRKCFWSTFRERGFRLELARHGASPTTFDRSKTSLEAWLMSLPKPAAVFTVSDCTAVNVIEACRNLRLRIPEQVSVLGVNNDKLYCEAVRPQLSSIHPDHVELGRRAAAELDRLMARPSPRKDVFIPPIRLVERASTKTIPPAGHLVKEALAFVRNHCQNGISVRDVAQHLNVSESLLRYRFRTVRGESVRDILLNARIEAAKRMLRKTDASITDIAAGCGFSSIHRFSHFFRDRTGLSPLAWRQTNGAAS